MTIPSMITISSGKEPEQRSRKDFQTFKHEAAILTTFPLHPSSDLDPHFRRSLGSVRFDCRSYPEHSIRKHPCLRLSPLLFLRQHVLRSQLGFVPNHDNRFHVTPHHYFLTLLAALLRPRPPFLPHFISSDI